MDTLGNSAYEVIDDPTTISQWNGRQIRLEELGNQEIANLVGLALKNERDIATCSFLGGYLDPEAKKAQEFEIDVLLYATHCASLEQEQHKISLLERLASGMLMLGQIGILVIKKDYINEIIPLINI